MWLWESNDKHKTNSKDANLYPSLSNKHIKDIDVLILTRSKYHEGLFFSIEGQNIGSVANIDGYKWDQLYYIVNRHDDYNYDYWVHDKLNVNWTAIIVHNERNTYV